jgi:hypothetical protein
MKRSLSTVAHRTEWRSPTGQGLRTLRHPRTASRRRGTRCAEGHTIASHRRSANRTIRIPGAGTAFPRPSRRLCAEMLPRRIRFSAGYARMVTSLWRLRRMHGPPCRSTSESCSSRMAPHRRFITGTGARGPASRFRRQRRVQPSRGSMSAVGTVDLAGVARSVLAAPRYTRTVCVSARRWRGVTARRRARRATLASSSPCPASTRPSRTMLGSASRHRNASRLR